jgi:hypothetical protein
MAKKTKRKPTEWNKHLMAEWNKMKKKDKNATFTDAMKSAKKTYKPKK